MLWPSFSCFCACLPPSRSTLSQPTFNQPFYLVVEPALYYITPTTNYQLPTTTYTLKQPRTTTTMIRPLLQLLILTATLITTSAEELPYFNFVGVPHPVIVNSSDPTYLDCSTITYGVDWFGRNNTNMRWSPPTASPSLSIPPVSSQAQPPSNPFFDPAKPSVLHFPGWEKGRCLVNQKTTFNFRRNQWDGSIHMPVNENAADYWVDDYNIGIFQVCIHILPRSFRRSEPSFTSITTNPSSVELL